jgi:hypothetical protein
MELERQLNFLMTVECYHGGTYAMDEANYLFFGKSYNTELDPDTRYIKMHAVKFTICIDNRSCCHEKLFG